MSDGKRIEKIVRLIQESIKNVPNTEIFSNYKIPNTSGRKREIDVFIKSQINGLDINIAIECKDYKIAIPVDKIEAFNSKCQRIKGISKKVFVSSNGYQADSIEAAKDFDIELFKLNEISKENIHQWFPIKELKANIKLQTPYKIQVQGGDVDIEAVSEGEEPILHFYENRSPILLTAFLWNLLVVPHQNLIQNCMALEFMKGNCRKEEGKHTHLPFKLNLTGAYILGKDNKKLNVNKIESDIVCWYDIKQATIIEAMNYLKFENNPDATIVSVNLGKSDRADIVFSKNNDISFFNTKFDGKTSKMKVLATYNPNTDELKIEDNKKRTNIELS